MATAASQDFTQDDSMRQIRAVVLWASKVPGEGRQPVYTKDGGLACYVRADIVIADDLSDALHIGFKSERADETTLNSVEAV